MVLHGVHPIHGHVVDDAHARHDHRGGDAEVHPDAEDRYPEAGLLGVSSEGDDLDDADHNVEPDHSHAPGAAHAAEHAVHGIRK